MIAMPPRCFPAPLFIRKARPTEHPPTNSLLLRSGTLSIPSRSPKIRQLWDLSQLSPQPEPIDLIPIPQPLNPPIKSVASMHSAQLHAQLQQPLIHLLFLALKQLFQDDACGRECDFLGPVEDAGDAAADEAEDGEEEEER